MLVYCQFIESNYDRNCQNGLIQLLIFLEFEQLQTNLKVKIKAVYLIFSKTQNQMLSQSLLKQLQKRPEQFSLNQVLLSLCKKSTISSGTPAIDFLDFEDKIQSIGHFHEKTCDEIVAFVDMHCAEYIQINERFQSLEEKISKVQNIIKLVSTKVKDYAKVYYQDQANIQDIISKYQTSIVQKLLLTKCKQQTQFLTIFVLSFESIISKSMDSLVFKQRALLIRFCYKFKYLQSLFNHHLLHQTLPEYIKIYQILNNLVDQVQFYISEQLSKLIKYKSVQCDQNQTKDPKIVALNQIKLCYKYLNKLPQYYKNMEQNLIGRQMQLAQKNLVANKINLIGGKNIQVVQDFFRCIFSSIKQFPKSYPRKRILQLIFNQLKKNQVKFIYTYTLPIFPISYNNYMKFVNSLDESENQLKSYLKQNHSWDLKRWIDVRQKNILDRCQKDWQKQTEKDKKSEFSQKQMQNQKVKCPELNKWIDIIFKENCRIDGVKTQIIKLGIKVVNKYAAFIEQLEGFEIQFLNKYIEIHENLQKTMNQKITFFFQSSQSVSLEQITNIATRISLSCKSVVRNSILRIIQKNTQLLSKSCCGSLQLFKSFIMKIIKSSKQLTQYGIINIFSNVFKPLLSYLESNSNLSSQAKKWIRQSVMRQVMKFYDQSYVNEVYQYSRTNLSVEQLAQVMEIVGKERGVLFVEVAQSDELKKAYK